MEVVGAGRDLEPVAREGQGADGLPPDADEQVGLDQPGEQDDARHEDEQGGQEAAGAAGPEPAQVDPPVARVLAHEQGGDEEAGDDEEDVDTEEAAGQPARVEVEDEDGEDRGRTQPVEAGEPAAGRDAAPGGAAGVAAAGPSEGLLHAHVPQAMEEHRQGRGGARAGATYDRRHGEPASTRGRRRARSPSG